MFSTALANPPKQRSNSSVYCNFKHVPEDKKHVKKYALQNENCLSILFRAVLLKLERAEKPPRYLVKTQILMQQSQEGPEILLS
jgi:hypothetical protein